MILLLRRCTWFYEYIGLIQRKEQSKAMKASSQRSGVGPKGLFAVIRSDIAGRPPLSPEPSQGLLWLEEVAEEEALHVDAPKPIVLGRHLIDRGLKPGAYFKRILDELFERQLDGVFSTLEEAEPHISELCDRHVT